MSDICYCLVMKVGIDNETLESCMKINPLIIISIGLAREIGLIAQAPLLVRSITGLSASSYYKEVMWAWQHPFH